MEEKVFKTKSNSKKYSTIIRPKTTITKNKTFFKEERPYTGVIDPIKKKKER